MILEKDRSKWYSFHCENYGKFCGTSHYHMCGRCRGDINGGSCGQFKLKRKKKDRS